MEKDRICEKTVSSVKTTIDNVLSERGSVYGDFRTQADLCQLLKDDVRNQGNWQKLQPYEKEAIDMILHKIARLVNGGGGSKHIDTVVDLQGYSKLIQDEYERIGNV